MNLVLITTNLLKILKQFPLNSKRKVVIDLLERFLKQIKGENIPHPTKDELKTAIDEIKELKQQWVSSHQEYNAIEIQAEYFKQLID